MGASRSSSSMPPQGRSWGLFLIPVAVSCGVITLVSVSLLGSDVEPVERPEVVRAKSQVTRAPIQESYASVREGKPTSASPAPAPSRPEPASRGFSPVLDRKETADEAPEYDEDGMLIEAEDEGGEDSGASDPEVRARAKARLRERHKSGKGIFGMFKRPPAVVAAIEQAAEKESAQGDAALGEPAAQDPAAQDPADPQSTQEHTQTGLGGAVGLQ